MKYVDAILKDWQEKGIKTPDDLLVYQQKRREENNLANNEQTAKVAKVKNSRGKMNNFQHAGQDYRQLEE